MSKINIHYGAVQIEFEGSEDFIKENLVDLFSEIVAAGPALPSSTSKLGPAAASGPEDQSLDISVKSISAKLGNSKGSDLLKAAAAYLIFVKGQETFSLQQLHDAMKTATGIYKQSTHGNNLSSMTLGLVKAEFLIETSSGNYTIAESQRDALKAALVNG